jgi:hypothetical protein
MKDKKVKQVLSRSKYHWEGGGHKERRANMMEIFCIHV